VPIDAAGMIQQQAAAASPGRDPPSYYRGLLQEHERVGGSLRSFAAARGVSAWTLYDWRRRLGRARAPAPVQSSSLVAVDVVSDRRPSSSGKGERIEVVLSDGLRVRLPTSTTAERLAAVVKVLRSC